MEKNYKFTESWFDIAIPVWEQVFERYKLYCISLFIILRIL